MPSKALIVAAILAFSTSISIAAPVPQLAGEGAACNSIFSSTDNGIGYGVENAEDNLAGTVATVPGARRRRQLAGEGAACNSILSQTDNGVGHGIENAEENTANLIATTGLKFSRQLDKIANGAQALSEAAKTGAATSALTGALDTIDGSSTSGAANIGAEIGTTEDSTLETVGKAVPKM